MNPLKRIIAFFAIILVFISCTERLPVQQEEVTIHTFNKTGQQLKIMTRNLYIGTDVDIVLAAQDPTEIPGLVTQAFSTLLATNFPVRALALAAEVAEANPDLIGLQEVSLIRTQIPGDAVVGGSVPAEDELMNYLTFFQTALTSFGLDYQIVGMVQNADVELPMVTGMIQNIYEFGDVRITDYDVVLARNDIVVKEVNTGNYKSQISMPDFGIEIPRGYVNCTVEINGDEYQFINTHLEPADYGGYPLKIQMEQARELMAMLASVKIPVILVGDFNSPAPIGETYNIVTGIHKFVDVWNENVLTDNPEGYTFGHDADLLNAEQNFYQRIDYIFVRDNKPYHKHTQIGSVQAYVTGDEVIDKTPSGLWPSDHGGVVATFQFITDDELAKN